MIDELDSALKIYLEKWQKLISSTKDKQFFERLISTAVGWKTTDLAEFDTRLAELREHADQIHIGWVNERWLATIHFRDASLAGGLTVVKLMQRRPGSTDAIGLDHVDFYLNPKDGDAKEILSQESSLKWTEEMNGEHCKWLSIWADGIEAKLRSDTVLDVCIEEMKDVNAHIMANSREEV